MDYKREWHVTLTESARWGARAVHVLGPRELGEGTEGDDRAVCGSGGEERPCVRGRTGAGSCAGSTRARAGARAAAAATTAAAAAGASGASAARSSTIVAERIFPDGYCRIVSKCVMRSSQSIR